MYAHAVAYSWIPVELIWHRFVQPGLTGHFRVPNIKNILILLQHFFFASVVDEVNIFESLLWNKAYYDFRYTRKDYEFNVYVKGKEGIKTVVSFSGESVNNRRKFVGLHLPNLTGIFDI